MNMLLFLVLCILGGVFVNIMLSHRHKRISSEIVKRLDEHHLYSQENLESVRKQTDEIKAVLNGLHNNQSEDEDITGFISTGKFKT